MKKVLEVSWDEYLDMVVQLANAIKESPLKPRCIYGIPRGGLQIAVPLSHRLNGTPVTLDLVGDFILFVDDISDEGKSLTACTNVCRNHITATLFIKKGTTFVPDFYVGEVEKDVWVKFPWELNSEPRNKAAKLKEIKEIKNRK